MAQPSCKEKKEGVEHSFPDLPRVWASGILQGTSTQPTKTEAKQNSGGVSGVPSERERGEV